MFNRMLCAVVTSQHQGNVFISIFSVSQAVKKSFFHCLFIKELGVQIKKL